MQTLAGSEPPGQAELTGTHKAGHTQAAAAAQHHIYGDSEETDVPGRVAIGLGI